MSPNPWSQLRHDLCTPVNALIGYAELLLEEWAESENISGITELKEIRHLSQQLLETINRLIGPEQEGWRSIASQLHKATRSPLNTIQDDCQRLLNIAPANFTTDLQWILRAVDQFRDRLDALETGQSDEEISKTLVDGAAIATLVPQSSPTQGQILVVDDQPQNCDLLRQHLLRQHYTVDIALSGQSALNQIAQGDYDLILLDVMMPGIDGYQVLHRLKAHVQWQHIPVIMISALDEIESVVQCIEQGAEDYLPKPFNPVLLWARIDACLEKKRLRDQELAYQAERTELLEQLAAENQRLNELNGLLKTEKERSERLLLNILPAAIAEQLKQEQQLIAEQFDAVTILFADLVNFTQVAQTLHPKELVNLLNQIFSMFDRLAEQHGLEKIKTIGDAYMVVSGVPVPQPDHAVRIAEMALAMQTEIQQFRQPNGQPFALRIGINSGPVVAGVIGLNRFIYDLWGDTVNVASRMESQGREGDTQVTETTYQLLQQQYDFEPRGTIEIKGREAMPTYWLRGRKSCLS
ncbi:MAG: response regulator [Spirulina sp. SIO3F2]|nr:response regulator [Spirulina sp. SIO3F2]